MPLYEEPKKDKPGFKTTEFWVAIGTNVVPMLVLAGVVQPSDADGIVNNWNMLIANIGGAGAAFFYILSRTAVKTKK